MVLPNRWLACPDSVANRDQPGDWVWASVFAKYLDPTTRGASGSSFAQLIRDLENNASHVVTDGATAGTNPSIPFAGMMGHGAEDTGAPKAYLNILVFNEEDELVNFAYKQISTSASEDGSDVPHENMDVYTPIYEPGYVYIYLSNESGSRVEVFFDDFRVTQAHGLIVQKDDFYPFGLSFNSYMRPGEVDQKYRFNQGAGGKTFRTERVEDFGLNVDMAKFRVYDYSLGRFWQSDPKSDVGGQESLTPYQYSFNNPIRYSDPYGDCPTCWQAIKTVYTGLRAKYSGILIQAQASSQRLVSGTSGSVPSGMGMGAGTQAVMQAAGVASDVNTVVETGTTLGKEVIMDTGEVLDKGGEVISDVGVALAVPTEGASLSLVAVGEGMSATGKAMKAAVHISNGNAEGAIREGVNAAVGAVTNSGTKAAINYSKKVGTITTKSQELINKTALGVVSSSTNKATSVATEIIKEENEQ